MSKQKSSTIRDVANYAGVSISSVSRVLSNHPNISPNLRQRVESAVEALKYEPHFLAHGLRRGTTSSIGFLVGTISNPIMADISAKASELLSSQGYSMLLVCSQNEPQADVDYLHFLARRQVSGLIVSTASNGPDQSMPLITELGVPTVMLDRELTNAPHVSAVQSDHKSGMCAAVAHLLEQGHRRIALIGGYDFIFPARERLRGFKAAFQEADLSYDPALVRSVGFPAHRAYAETDDLLGLAEPPTALIAAGNTTLIGVLQSLQEQNVVVGRDIALIGCDDTALAQLYSPPITVIERDLVLLGETAATLLLDTIRNGGGQRIELPTKLIVRESSIGVSV